MGKRKGYKLPLSSFFNWSAEEQARFIERETKNVIKRLPRLKSALQMYNEVSDELYNLRAEELELIGNTYAQAVRNEEITTPSSKNAYRNFIRNLRKYSRISIRELAIQTAEQRMDSWLENVKANGSLAEIEYATDLINNMTESQKIGFTKSKYFLDVENWNSKDFVKDTEMGEISIQTLKLELYLQQYDERKTKNIYNQFVAKDKENVIRGATRGRKGKRKKVK